MDPRTSCCFTGHRPEKLPWGRNETDPRCLRLKEQISAAIDSLWQAGVRHFICGMALGTDTYFCEAALAFREAHPDITVEAAIPCESQPSRWTSAEQTRYYDLVSRCDFETVVQHEYTPGCMQRRNRYMVDHASYLLAVYDGTQGGTMRTLLYAGRQGLDITVLDLNEYRE